MSTNEETAPTPLDVIEQEHGNSSLSEVDDKFYGNQNKEQDVIPFEVKLDRLKLKAKYAELMSQKPAKMKKNYLLNRNLLKHFKVKKVYSWILLHLNFYL